MKGCLAPSEIPGIDFSEASTFGWVAEELIFMDFCNQYGCISTFPPRYFKDNNDEIGYLYFLAANNPTFTSDQQNELFNRLRGDDLFKMPDIMVHKTTEKTFYEIKPNSVSGRSDGKRKIAYLSATYDYYNLPYRTGITFSPNDHRIGFLSNQLTVTLKVVREEPGLILYKICLESREAIEVAVLGVLLAYIVRQLNRQRGRTRITQIDLQPVFVGNRQLGELATALGLVMAAGAGVAAAVTWRHFWRAVIVRFAVRGATALGLAAADGPLPVGDLIATGLAVWTIVDIIRLSDELWRDASVIAQQEA